MLYIDALVIKRDQTPALIKLTVYYYLGWGKQTISSLQQGKSAHLFLQSFLKKGNSSLVSFVWVHLTSNTKKKKKTSKPKKRKKPHSKQKPPPKQLALQKTSDI